MSTQTTSTMTVRTTATRNHCYVTQPINGIHGVADKMHNQQTFNAIYIDAFGILLIFGGAAKYDTIKRKT